MARQRKLLPERKAFINGLLFCHCFAIGRYNLLCEKSFLQNHQLHTHHEDE